jgi:DNA-binding transcriptional ArsR family regulator
MESKDFYQLHSEICKTLANPKRQEILDCLREKEMTVNELVEKTGNSQANISQHLSILRAKGIVVSRRKGIHVYYSLANNKIIRAFDLISEVLKESLASRTEMISQSANKNQPE